MRAGAGREPHRTPQDPAQKRPHVLSFGVLSFGTGQSGQLILHTATYCLLWSVRRAIAQTRPLRQAGCASLQRHPVETAARAIETATRIAFAAACPDKAAFIDLL